MEEYLAFSLYDINGDGLISLSEMTAYLEQLYGMMDPALASNPVLLQQKASSAAAKCFTEADINNDGAVNFEEFKRWYAMNNKGSSGAMNNGSGTQASEQFSVDFPEATYCVYHDADVQGRRLYRSVNSVDHKVKNFHKDVFVAYLLVITRGGNTWRILRRYSSMLDFCKQLRKDDPKLVEPVSFPSKKLGEVDIDARRLALKAYFQGLLHNPYIHSLPLVRQFFTETDADINSHNSSAGVQPSITPAGVQIQFANHNADYEPSVAGSAFSSFTPQQAARRGSASSYTTPMGPTMGGNSNQFGGSGGSQFGRSQMGMQPNFHTSPSMETSPGATMSGMHPGQHDMGTDMGMGMGAGMGMGMGIGMGMGGGMQGSASSLRTGMVLTVVAQVPAR